jgi:drug/metabolite transporter (DMT)-like permease
VAIVIRHTREVGKTAALTALAMLAFAANSLLCRGALRTDAIDAASFTLVRLASGALVLSLLVRLRSAKANAPRNVRSAIALFVYAIGFSIAYLKLSAGTGALVLFGCVQTTMIAAGIRAGERPRLSVWVALAVAFAGLVGLTFPGLDAPHPVAALLMAIAGVAWGIYSLRGRGAPDPLAATAINFVWAVPLGLVTFAIGIAFAPHATTRGLLLAAASGGIASGVGYSIWYTALRGLNATRAAVVQLSVPLIAAVGGAAMLGEAPTARLVVSGIAILGGVAFVLGRR